MMGAKFIDEITRAVRGALPAGLAEEAEKNVRAALRGVFDRLDLVTREELEVQEQVLMRTRARLGEMEQRVAELEAKLLNKK